MRETICLSPPLTEQRSILHEGLLLGVLCQLRTPYALLSQAYV